MEPQALREWPDGFDKFKRRGFRLALGFGPMRIFILFVISLSLLLIPWQIAASNPLTTPRSTPTEKVCHDCEEDESTWLGDSATITPTAAMATPYPTDDCRECEINADRVRALSTQAAREEALSISQDAVIHILVFWMQSCPHCHDVIEDVLPPLQENYGDLMEILLIEIVTVEDVDEFYQIAAELGIPKESTGVPLLIIGNEVLIGYNDIQAHLPRLIQEDLAEGGIDLPQVLGLDAFLERLSTQRFTLSGGIAASMTATELPIALSDVDGAGLAVTTLIGMVLVLFYAGVVIFGAYRGEKTEAGPPWLAYATPILALVGVSVAGYLAYIETQMIPAVCGPVGDCNAVQSSPYAWVMGVMPVGLLGVLGYLGIVAAWFWGRFNDDRLATLTPLVIFGMTLCGVLFSIYLTYLELFVIHAICSWCLSSAIIITVLFLLSLRPMVQAIKTQET